MSQHPAADPPPEPEQDSPEAGEPTTRESRSLDQLSERFLGKPGKALGPAEPLDLRALRAAAQALKATPDAPTPTQATPAAAVNAVMDSVMNSVMEAAAAQAIRLYLAGPHGLLRVRAGRSRWEEVPFLALVLRLEAGTLGRVLRSGEPVLMRESFEVLSGPPELAASEEVHCLALPLKVRAEARGVLLLFRDGPFGPGAVGAMGESAAGLGLVVDYLELVAAGARNNSA